MCRFLDAGGINLVRTLGRPASKKRQGTKSRGAGPWLGGVPLWGFQVCGAFDGGAASGRRDLHACARRGVGGWKKRPDGVLNGIDGRRAHGLP